VRPVLAFPARELIFPLDRTFRLAQNLKNRAEDLERTYATADHYLAECGVNRRSRKAKDVLLRNVGRTWVSMPPLEPKRIKHLSHDWRVHHQCPYHDWTFRNVAKEVSKMFDYLLADTDSRRYTLSFELTSAYEELFDAIIDSVVPPRVNKRRRQPPRWKPFLLFIAPPPIPSYIAPLSKKLAFAYHIASMQGFDNSRPDGVRDFESAVSTYCREMDGKVCACRTAKTVELYLLALQMRLDAKKEEERLQQQILEAVFEWKEMKEVLRRWRLSRA
jgi:hypothetical protein